MVETEINRQNQENTSVCKNALFSSQLIGQFLCCRDGKCVAKQQGVDCPSDVNRTLVRCQKISSLDCCKAFEEYKDDKFLGKDISDEIKQVCQHRDGVFCLSTPNLSIEGSSKSIHEKQMEWMISRSKVGEYSIGSYACCDSKGCLLNDFVDESAYLEGKNHPISPGNGPNCFGFALSSGVHTDTLCKDSKLAVICPNLYQSGKCRLWGTECENPLLLSYQVIPCNETGGEIITNNNLSLSSSPMVTCPPNPATGLSVGEIVGIATGAGSFVAATTSVIIAYRKYKLSKKKLETITNDGKNEDQIEEIKESSEAEVSDSLMSNVEEQSEQLEAQIQIPPK
jgi:hypothetical protein